MRPTSAAAGWRGLALVAIAVLVLDQLSKAIVIAEIPKGDLVEVIPGILDLVHVGNEGVAFGLLGNAGSLVVALVAGLVLLSVLFWFSLDPTRPWAWVAIGLLVGGAVGNLIDRMRHGAVTDFIDLPAWPSFNVADMAITFGALALVLAAFAQPDPDTDNGEGAESDSTGIERSDVAGTDPGGA